jgi:hypothetical protein
MTCTSTEAARVAAPVSAPVDVPHYECPACRDTGYEVFALRRARLDVLCRFCKGAAAQPKDDNDDE